MDNEAVTEFISYNFHRAEEGFRIRFQLDNETTGWWNYLDGLRDSYSAIKVLMDIDPVRVTVEDVQ